MTRQRTKTKRTPPKRAFYPSNLREAVSLGTLTDVKGLVVAGADINEANNEEFTPVMHASGRGDLGIANYLIERGAELDRRNDIGQTALMIAATTGKKEMIELLLRAGADATAFDDYKRNAVAWAATRGDFPDAVVCLAKSGADVNAPDMDGFTPLMRAAIMGYPKTVASLLKLGAQPKRKWKGKTALQITVERGNTSVCEILESAR